MVATLPELTEVPQVTESPVHVSSLILGFGLLLFFFFFYWMRKKLKVSLSADHAVNVYTGLLLPSKDGLLCKSELYKAGS